MINVTGSIFAMTNKKEKIRTRMFVFADFTVTEEYEEFMQFLKDKPGSKIIEEKENFDMQGTLTKIVTYSIVEDNL
jgi:hypothetical protein